ncbi:potassium voltage-gated channel subfamily KQT member 1-like isoform X1 [Pogonomyrmex barbatus]|uniref:Potassium voltage-gated channel subfamily KQT member 1-like isoform X1 n=2 Tax=Pogonomyrmex barbatus TaxID=144034 RepID=A0A6I9X2P8_9HYME|nr:potassium voltage-gated channel subfamily KQT member 1-like isoform X1 [Pogonomyrmex barbatus]
MRDHSHHYRDHGHAMPLEEVQGLLLPPSRTGNRGPLNVTIVQVGRGNGGGDEGGSDLLRLEPPSDFRPAPSLLSNASVTLQSDNNDTLVGGVDPRLLLGTGGDRNTWEGRYHEKEHRRAGKATFQGQVYNFLERPTGWKCFLYHFSVLSAAKRDNFVRKVGL